MLVVIDGRVVMRDRRAVGWDCRAFVKEQEAFARQMIADSGITRAHGVSSTFRRKA